MAVCEEPSVLLAGRMEAGGAGRHWGGARGPQGCHSVPWPAHWLQRCVHIIMCVLYIFILE